MDTGQRTADWVRARRKRAELAGGLGAGALGMGLGVVLAGYLQGAGVLLVVVGTALHATGMWDKHLLERSERERALWWETLFYWSCWAILGGLLLYLAIRFDRR